MTAGWAAVRTSAPPEDSKPASATSIAGKWNAKSTSDNGEMESVVTFTKDGEKFKGTATSDNGSLDFDSVKVDGKNVEIELTFDINDTEVPITIKADQTDDDHLKGKWIVFDESGQEEASGAWTAERALTLDLAGTWGVVATTDDGDLEFKSIFEKTDSGYKGKTVSNQGSNDYSLVKVSDNDVKLEAPFGEGTVKVAASYKEKNKLTGKWTYFDSSDSEVASDAWVATKEVKEEPKASPIAGEWAIEITFGDQDPRDYSMKISEEGDALKGVFISPRSGETKCDSVAFKDDALEMKVTRDIQGNEIQFIYKGKLADDKLSGSVVPKGYEDQFSGEWTAKRKS
ncbi:MAG: hypothetical protein ACI8T1_003201 [Verrucomicrobiales bacterium]|jgi:hypothetical protein